MTARTARKARDPEQILILKQAKASVKPDPYSADRSALIAAFHTFAGRHGYPDARAICAKLASANLPALKEDARAKAERIWKGAVA